MDRTVQLKNRLGLKVHLILVNDIKNKYASTGLVCHLSNAVCLVGHTQYQQKNNTQYNTIHTLRYFLRPYELLCGHSAT